MKKTPADQTTEEKIKEAARLVFHKKGYAAARTRDIAEAAGINLALLNYYFRSKEKLFGIIMMESFQAFIQSIRDIFDDGSTSLEEKIETLVARYIDLLTQQPTIPLFLLSELRNRPEELISKINMKDVLIKSCFIRQFQEEVKAGRIVPMHPMHFIMNLLSVTIFPFVASPLLQHLGNLSEKNFNDLMQQRKTLIPKWIGIILHSKQ